MLLQDPKKLLNSSTSKWLIILIICLLKYIYKNSCNNLNLLWYLKKKSTFINHTFKGLSNKCLKYPFWTLVKPPHPINCRISFVSWPYKRRKLQQNKNLHCAVLRKSQNAAFVEPNVYFKRDSQEKILQICAIVSSRHRIAPLGWRRTNNTSN